MSRRRLTRTSAAIAVTVASLAAGVVGARAIRGSDDATADSPTAMDAAPVLVDPNTTMPAPAGNDDDLIPVLAPVAVSTDPSVVDRLLDPPSDATGTDETGAVAIPHGMAGPGVPAVRSGEPAPAGDGGTGDGTGDSLPAGSGGGAEPMLGEPPLAPSSWYARLGALFPVPVQFVDACAGTTPRPPEMLPPPRCPDGVGGTVTGDGAPRHTAVWINSPHLLEDSSRPAHVLCPVGTPAPAAGRDPYTLVSTNPLATATVHLRRRGDTGAWQDTTIDGTVLAQQQAAFDAAEAAGRFGDEVPLVGHCFDVARDPDLPYEMYATGTDVFGRPFSTITFTLSDRTPEGRPPSEVEIDPATNRATIRSFTTTGGSIDFRWFPVAAGEEPAADDCAAAADFPMIERAGRGPLPAGIWDPRFSVGREATVELPAGGGGVLCATVYDTENTIRPLATDVFLVRGSRRQVARVELVGFRLHSGVTIDRGHLGIAARYEDGPVPEDGCSGQWVNADAAVAAPGLVVGDFPLWECALTPQPVDERGYVKVPITVTRRVPGATGANAYQRWVAGIPIQFDDCRTGYCPFRPDEYFELSVPTGEMSLRGCVFDCDSAPPSAGAAIVRLRFDVVGAGTTGSSVLLSSTDRAGDPVGGVPGITVDSQTAFEPTGASPFAELRTEYRLFADRPLTIVGGRMVPELISDTSSCAAERPVEVLTAGAVTEFSFAVTVPCPNMTYSVLLTVRDAAGTEFEQQVVYDRAPQLVGRNVMTTVEFLDDTAGNTAGLLYDFSVSVDSTWAADPPYAWQWSGRHPSDPRYLCVAWGSTTARTTWGLDELWVLHPEALYAGVRVNFTSLCDGSGSARGAAGEQTLVGRAEFGDLRDGEPIVFTSPADARIQLRLTVTADRWYLVD